MPMLILPQRTLQQRLQAQQVDWSNPLTQGLVFCAYPVGGAFYDAVSNQYAGHTGTLRARQGADGNRMAAVSAIGSNAAGGNFTNKTGMDNITGAHSVFLEGSLEVNATTGHVVSSVASATGDGFALRFDDVAVVNNGFLYWRNNGNGVASNSTALGSNSEQFTHRVMLTNDGTNANFYAKGLLNRTVANSTMPTGHANRRTTIGFNGSETNTSMSIALVWSRVLSLPEYLALYENPWRVLKNTARKMLVDVVGGGGGFQAAWALNSNQLFQRGVAR